jgi:hypothetical protein
LVLRRRDCQRADRRHFLIIEDRLPLRAAVRRLPNAARRCADVNNQRIAGLANNRRCTISHRANVAELQLRKRILRSL